MADDIKNNLSFLAHHLINLKGILLELIENDVISQDDSDEIESKETPLRRNSRLLDIIQKKDWHSVKELFLRILRKTKNEHCVRALEDLPNEPRQVKRPQHNLLRQTWWPEKKRLIKSLHKRRIGDKLLVDELHDRLEKDENRMVVITESLDASKLTGMGGVGKTLTATWYAHKYENYYDHVLWIDCGEGSLLTSFQDLTRDLKIEDGNELIDVKEFSRKSYRELKQFKCLWIFDNAENYKGQGGMLKVLPNDMKSFSCLITSRSSKWGVKNIGYGKIFDLHLDIFSEQESLQFFKQNLDREIKYSEFQLRQLCCLLGNLPLALQLAVAALNEGEINLKNYIEKTSAQDILESIVDAEFDAYEKTINASVKITLDLLAKEKNGNAAKDILIIFGYIRPDDVILDLFVEVLKLSTEDVNEGIVLLFKYSLISKEIKTIHGKTKSFLSIHRLLQQVVRHNFREREKETLRKILRCNGYLPYKLLPFTKYADAEVRKEFPKVKAELLDQQELLKLVWEKRFDESVQLAEFIDQELQKEVTKFNYAVCLEMNGQLEDEINVLEALYHQGIEEAEMIHRGYDDVVMGLLGLEAKVTKCLVGGHLLVSHWKMNNRERMHEILQERKSIKMISSEEMITSLMKILSGINCNYSLTNEWPMLKIALDGDTKRIELENISVDMSVPLPNDLQELRLQSALFKDGNGKFANVIDATDWLPKKLKKLDISCRKQQLILTLRCISSIENITLSNKCSLILDSVTRISPLQLKLVGVSFSKKGQELSTVNLNEFIDFHKMKRLEFNCLSLMSYPNKNVSIDLSEESANMEYLHLRGVTVLSLKSVNGNGRVNIKEAEIWFCSLDLSILPSSLGKLTLLVTELSVSGKVDLPNLKYLQLENIHFHRTYSHFQEPSEVIVSGGIELPNLKYLESDNISYLSYFRTFQLIYLHLYGVEEVNLDLIPRSAKTIRIGYYGGTIRSVVSINVRYTRLLGGPIHLDKLILSGFSLKKVKEMLSHFHLKQLVLYDHGYEPVDFTKLMDMKIPTIAIGIVDLIDEEFKSSIISKQVDRQSEYYLFQGGTGKAIEKKDFEELYLLTNIFRC